MVSDKTKDRIYKVLALANRGKAGEKESAKLMLEKLLKKHNLNIKEFETEETYQFRIKFKTTGFEQDLMWAILRKLLKRDTITYWRTQARSVIIVEMTKLQYAEFEYLFEIYKKEMAEEIEVATAAFIHKNKLYFFDEDEKREPSDGDITERQRKIVNRMLVMDKIQTNKAIEHSQ